MASADSGREPVRLKIDGDIDDWFEREPKRGRSKTRRVTQPSASRAAEATPAPAARRISPKKPHASHVVNARAPQARNSTVPVKPKRARRPFWQRMRNVCLMLCAVLVAEGAAALLSSPQCAISQVTVQGAQETPAVDLDLICTALIGQNFLRADKKGAIARAEKLPTVASAHLAHDWLTWPPRLVLSVTERTPFARVGAGSNWWVVDEKGVPFRPATAEDEKLYAVTSRRLVPKAGEALDAAAWKPVVEFAGALSRDAELAGGWNLRRVYFDKHGFASLRLTGGQNDETLVQLGAEGWPEKLQAARWALNDIAARGRHAASINLISSSVATWTPRGAVDGEGSEALPASTTEQATVGEGTPDEAATSGTPNSQPDANPA